MATIKLFGNLRSHVEASSLEISGANIRAVVDALCERNPSLSDALFEDGQIRPHFIITLNGRDVQLAQGLDTPINDGDQIAIFPPIAGGNQTQEKLWKAGPTKYSTLT
jgi:molybdopterin synthase sulfur carrier subunit